MSSLYLMPMAMDGPGYPSAYPVMPCCGGFVDPNNNIIMPPMPMDTGFYSPPIAPSLYQSPMDSFYQPSGGFHPPPAGITQLHDYKTSPERYGGLLVPSTSPLTVFTSAPTPGSSLYSGSMSSLYSGSPPMVTSVPSLPSDLLTPPPSPEPTVWVRPRLGPAPVPDPRSLAEVHGPDCVQQWTKSLRLGEYSRVEGGGGGGAEYLCSVCLHECSVFFD